MSKENSEQYFRASSDNAILELQTSTRKQIGLNQSAVSVAYAEFLVNFLWILISLIKAFSIDSVSSPARILFSSSQIPA